MTCRCGHEVGPHPCHGKGYSCKKPATQRFYHENKPFSLAGMSMKFPVSETWACDECWKSFSALLKGGQ